jgi:hypothetical protein
MEKKKLFLTPPGINSQLYGRPARSEVALVYELSHNLKK